MRSTPLFFLARATQTPHAGRHYVLMYEFTYYTHTIRIYMYVIYKLICHGVHSKMTMNELRSKWTKHQKREDK